MESSPEDLTYFGAGLDRKNLFEKYKISPYNN